MGFLTIKNDFLVLHLTIVQTIDSKAIDKCLPV